MEDMLDSVKTTRYQIGTFSHMSDEVDTFLDKLRGYTDNMEGFFSDRGNAVLLAGAIIASLVLINYIRAWLTVRIRWR